MKKFILGLGTVASTIAPVAAVVACGTDSNGLPTLNAVESTKIVTKFASVLGITMPSQNDAFQIKFTKLNKDGMTFTLETTSSDTASSITIANLEKSGGALEIVKDETLEFNFGFNSDMTDIASQKFTLSGSKTTAKNGVYTAKTGTLQSRNLLPVIKEILDEFNGYKVTNLTSVQLSTVISTLSKQATSAEAIFSDDDTMQVQATGDYSAYLSHATAKLISKVEKTGKFDFKFEVTATSGHFVIVTGATAKDFKYVYKGDKAIIHLVGALGTDGRYTLTTNESKVSTSMNDNFALNEKGAKLLASALNVIASATA